MGELLLFSVDVRAHGLHALKDEVQIFDGGRARVQCKPCTLESWTEAFVKAWRQPCLAGASCPEAPAHIQGYLAHKKEKKT